MRAYLTRSDCNLLANNSSKNSYFRNILFSSSYITLSLLIPYNLRLPWTLLFTKARLNKSAHSFTTAEGETPVFRAMSLRWNFEVGLRKSNLRIRIWVRDLNSLSSGLFKKTVSRDFGLA